MGVHVIISFPACILLTREADRFADVARKPAIGAMDARAFRAGAMAFSRRRGRGARKVGRPTRVAQREEGLLASKFAYVRLPAGQNFSLPARGAASYRSSWTPAAPAAFAETQNPMSACRPRTLKNKRSCLHTRQSKIKVLPQCLDGHRFPAAEFKMKCRCLSPAFTSSTSYVVQQSVCTEACAHAPGPKNAILSCNAISCICTSVFERFRVRQNAPNHLSMQPRELPLELRCLHATPGAAQHKLLTQYDQAHRTAA